MKDVVDQVDADGEVREGGVGRKIRRVGNNDLIRADCRDAAETHTQLFDCNPVADAH